MTLNQRKSELYALAALTVGVAGLGPETWWWTGLWKRDGRWGREAERKGGVEGGKVGNERVRGTDGDETVEGKRRTWNLVRGLLVFGGGVGAGGWAVWG